MRIAFVTTANLEAPETWPNTLWGLYCAARRMADTFAAQPDVSVEFVGPLDAAPVRKSTQIKQQLYKKIGQNYSPYGEYYSMRHYARQIEEKLRQIRPDLIFCYDDGLALSFVKTDVPMVMYRDTLLTPLYDYYEHLNNVCGETRRHVRVMERRTLSMCSKVFLASDWARDMALRTYDMPPEKFAVVPFAACIEPEESEEDIAENIEEKQMQNIECVFFGIDWVRKGGDKAVRVVRYLNARGHKARLTVIGCTPDIAERDRAFVHILGRLQQWEPSEVRQMKDALCRAHFLVMPVRAECFGHVFCEANAFGVPCLASATGGVTTAIRDGINGKLFSVDAQPEEYCDAIEEFMNNPEAYRKLAHSAYREYAERLHWTAAVRSVLREVASLV